MPLSTDIGNAYRDYYTHEDAIGPGPLSLLKRSYYAVKRAYLATRFGYGVVPGRGVLNGIGWLLYLFPVRRSEVDEEVRHLRSVPGGSLLDVGCGSGAWLLQMQQLGWRVRGVDFDADAVALASRRGLQVDQGSLEAQQYSDSRFDAVTLNHVIEHVPDPVATLAECRRILKVGGQVTMFTPNNASLGHRWLREAWRGLEPPRHLHIFSPGSMRAALLRAGFSHFEVRTVNSRYMWDRSLELRAKLLGAEPQLPRLVKFESKLLSLLEQILLVARPETGECLAVRATKK